jgi:hypothetical protein
VVVYTLQIYEPANRMPILGSEQGGKVLLIELNGDFQLQKATFFYGLRVVAVNQIAIDLLNGPG